MTVRDVAVGAYKEALPVLAASLVGDLVAGVAPGGIRAELRTVPGLFVLVPVLLATRGSVYGSLGACIATALHQGFAESRVTGGDERLRAAATAAFANGMLTSTSAAVVAYFLLTFLSGRIVPFPILAGVTVVAGLLSGIVLTVIVVSVVFVSHRRGRNLDTIVGPVVTTTGDAFGVSFLLIAIGTVLTIAKVF